MSAAGPEPEAAASPPRDAGTAPHILLSVVIPAYNYAALLERAMRSVLGQLGAETELVVVDDGSTDATPRLLQGMQGVPGLRWMRQDNAGAAAARNAGLRLSRGAFVLFLDADDELLPGALEAVCAAIRAEARASVILGGRIVREADGREKNHPPPADLDADPCARVGDYLLRKKIGMSHGATVMRRDLVSQRPYPEKLRGREDLPVFAYLLAHGIFARVERPLVRIHKHRDSLRHTHAASESHERALVEEIFERLPEACRSIRAPYAARRQLALFRGALRACDLARARRHIGHAAKLAPLQILEPRQIRKALKAALAGLGKRSRSG